MVAGFWLKWVRFRWPFFLLVGLFYFSKNRIGSIRQVEGVAAARRVLLVAPIGALAAIFVTMKAAFFGARAACFHPVILP
jgi:hypothetical protein